MNRRKKFDAVVVGAGIAGLYMLHRLRECGLAVVVLERADGVGGTWYWNRYPGARCDVESLEYSYTFSEELQQEWSWSERYAGQPEILRYIEHVADRFDLEPHIEFNTEVESARFDEQESQWLVRTNGSVCYVSQFLIMATGCLSSANIPVIEGIESFKGNAYHTGKWPHEPVDFSGQSVGIVGTGSSAIQAIPHIADQCKSLTVFQRTPNYSIPARNGSLDLDYEARIKARYPQFRQRNRAMPAALGCFHAANNQSVLDATEPERRREFSKRWEIGGFGFLGAFNDLTLNLDANDIAAEYVRGRIRETVSDPRVAETLCPDSTIGCKRLCLDTEYFETYNLPHVDLVDLRTNPIERLTGSGIQCAKSQFEFDSIVFATGFDAMTGTLLRIDISGRQGTRLEQAWNEGPKTYLGLMTHGFPNIFFISGPGSPSVLTNMIISIEQHVEWIERCLSYMQSHSYTTVEAEEESQVAWVEHVNAIADKTLYPTCNSWYLGANIPGKPRVFMPHVGFPSYVEKCEHVVANGYEGFSFA
ncbi:MAG: NAD(P)/FAD-dependent oxidoreductase [Gammaproteobacteria bacterium]|nr:NAD(P)/FAD-dependent oxidoreductase [Gammaproteobacteria bacterium]